MQRLYNLLTALPLIAWYVWGLSREVPAFLARTGAFITNGQTDALFALEAFTQASAIAFTSFIIFLLVVRDAPRAWVNGVGPYAVAMIGTFAASSLLFLPLADVSQSLLFVSAILITAGLALSFYTLIYLGRSFAILPSARGLVTDGPYRYIRHPLYLFEEVAIIGLMLQFALPWSLLIVLIHFAAQLARMHYEEKVLMTTFPEYALYAARTARLIPGVY